MKKPVKNPKLTLQAIGDLVDRKLVPVLGELDGLKQQINSLDNKIDSVDAKIEAHRKETKEGFDTVFDGLDNLGRAIDHNIEPRLKKLESRVFAQ